MKSISHRIYRVIALVSLISLTALLVITFLVSEDLESTMIRVELTQERDFFLARQTDPDRAVVHSTPGLTLAYVPGAAMGPAVQGSALPDVFRGLSPPFAGELYRDDATWLVSIEAVPGGVLYLARNISHFEEREWLFRLALFVVGGLIAVLSIVLAVLGARQVVKPLRLLAEKIHELPVGTSTARLPLDWNDSELNTIAQSFNGFVTELEAYVRREKSLLSLASHELRTPIAVISGALDILEQRGGLAPADQKTVARIRQATDEMQMNVAVLLTLARKSDRVSRAPEPLDLVAEVRQILHDLEVHYPVSTRVHLKASAPVQVVADPALVRMLVRNLVQNALQHTRERIFIDVQPGWIDVRDEGPGLDSAAQDVLAGRTSLALTEGPVSGLGLYLVTLMVERLGWRLDVLETSSRGTVIRVFHGDLPAV